MLKASCSKRFCCREPSKNVSFQEPVVVLSAAGFTGNLQDYLETKTFHISFRVLVGFYRNEGRRHQFNQFIFSRMPSKVLKPEDYERGARGPWRPQLGFNPNRQQAHLDQAGFRALG